MPKSQGASRERRATRGLHGLAYHANFSNVIVNREENTMTDLVKDLKRVVAVRAATAERLGRLSACVFIKEFLEDNGLPPLPLELRDQLISYCEQPTQHLTNDDLKAVYDND